MEHAQPALFSAPGAGTAARRVGRRRRRLAREGGRLHAELDPFKDTEWSPHGLYVDRSRARTSSSPSTPTAALGGSSPRHDPSWPRWEGDDGGCADRLRRRLPSGLPQATGPAITCSTRTPARPAGVGSGAAPHGHVVQRRRDRPALRGGRVARGDQGDHRRIIEWSKDGRYLAVGLAEADRPDRPARALCTARSRCLGAGCGRRRSSPAPQRSRRGRARCRTQRGPRRRHRPSRARPAALCGPGDLRRRRVGRRPSDLAAGQLAGCRTSGCFWWWRRCAPWRTSRQQLARADGLGPMLELRAAAEAVRSRFCPMLGGRRSRPGRNGLSRSRPSP